MTSLAELLSRAPARKARLYRSAKKAEVPFISRRKDGGCVLTSTIRESEFPFKNPDGSFKKAYSDVDPKKGLLTIYHLTDDERNIFLSAGRYPKETVWGRQDTERHRDSKMTLLLAGHDFAFKGKRMNVSEISRSANEIIFGLENDDNGYNTSGGRTLNNTGL